VKNDYGIEYEARALNGLEEPLKIGPDIVLEKLIITADVTLHRSMVILFAFRQIF
jgi:hypothetical protein